MTGEVAMGRRGGLRAAVVAGCAVAATALMVVELPLAAGAANKTYWDASSAHGVWHASPTLSSTGNQAYTQFGGANVTVDNGQSSTTAVAGATQTYSRRSVPLYCKWFLKGFESKSVPLNCVLFG